MQDGLSIPSVGGHLRMVRGGISEAVVFEEVYSGERIKDQSLLFTIETDTLPLSALRHLATQSLNLFESIQNMKDIDLESVVIKSREYRAILAECEEQLVTEIKALDQEMNCDDYRYGLVTSNCNIIKDYQLLWHLSEIFFIKISSGGFFIQDLQGWLNLQQPHISFQYNQLMDSYNLANGDIDIEDQDTYWSTIFGLTMHGRKSELLNLLVCNTLANSQAFRAVRYIIESLPIYDSDFLKCPGEFDLVWKRWHKAAQEQLVDSSLLTPYPQLVVVAGILLGKQEVFFSQEMINIAEGCWYYAIVPYLLYTQPMINVKEVSNSYKKFKKAFQSTLASVTENEAITEVCSEQILVTIDAIFNLDLGVFIHSISSNSNNWWLPAHLIDIIEKINPHLFPQPLKPVNDSDIFDDDLTYGEVASMKEFFVVQYSMGLASHHSLLMTALSYMDLCPVMGPSLISNIIDHMYLPTETMAIKIHNWCILRKHDAVASLICKRQAVSSFKRDNLGNSLCWSLRGKDSSFVSRIADRLLTRMMKDHEDGKEEEEEDTWMDIMECINNISLGVCGKKMTFVVKWYQVRMLMRNLKFQEAAVSLIQLIQSSLVSSTYNLAILRNVKPLLTMSGVLKMEDLYLLMEVLQDAPQVNDKEGTHDKEVRELRRLMVNQLSLVCVS